MKTSPRYLRPFLVKTKPRPAMRTLVFSVTAIALMAVGISPANSSNPNNVCVKPDVVTDGTVNVLDIVSITNAIVNAETDKLCVPIPATPQVGVELERGQIFLSSNSPDILAASNPSLSTGYLSYKWDYVLDDGSLVGSDPISFTLVEDGENLLVMRSSGTDFTVDRQGNFLEPITPDANASHAQRLLIPQVLVQGAHYSPSSNATPYTQAKIAALDEANERESKILSANSRVVGAIALEEGASLLILKRNLHLYVLPTYASLSEGAMLEAYGITGYSPGMQDQVGATWSYFVVASDGSSALLAEAALVMGRGTLVNSMNEVFVEEAPNHPITALVRLDLERSTLDNETLHTAMENALAILPTNPTNLFADYLPGAEIQSAYNSLNDPCVELE